MKKNLLKLFFLLIVTNSIAIADCTTGYVCSIKDLNENNTNSVIKSERENNQTKIEQKDDNKRNSVEKKIDKQQKETEIKKE